MEAALVALRAVLGPTNTGKTHLAVERLLAHGTGMIGLPLRLLAREVYDRMVRVKGAAACALVTGEEVIRPPQARYFACTVEAMPVSEGADFVAIDEIQLATDPDRGHVFTERILSARGHHETMLLGADTMRPALQSLSLHIDAERRERFSQLAYAGPIKITKLPKRSAVVAFSAEEVYAIAELLKRQRGGCAVIMGALSPRTRNAQVELYQSGEVDYVVATDAIGMGLNLDVGHVAFASRRKFDGRQRRLLQADELAQIAGRAGRFRDDGTFGETADCEAFDEETIERICDHRFEPVMQLNWRNADHDLSSPEALLRSLRRPSPHPTLRRAPEALDESTLAALADTADVRARVRRPDQVRRLWDLCRLPDFRKAGPDGHIRLVSGLVERLVDPAARLKDEWMFGQIERLDRTEGDIDTLQQRLAAIRTWTYAANRPDWVENAETWRGRTREIEDRLSDALHDRLLQRFVDRRTSALLKTLGDDDVEAEVDADGLVKVSGHVVGRLDGLVFVPDTQGRTLEGRALRNAALKALRPVLEQRLMALCRAEPDSLSLRLETAEILHAGSPAARLTRGASWLAPKVELLGAADAHAGLRDQAENRLRDWFRSRLADQLGPLLAIEGGLSGDALSGAARGLAFRLLETGAAIDRRSDGGAAADPAAEDREPLRALGVRLGRLAAWIPALLKPGPAELALCLRGLWLDRAAPRATGAASFAPDDAWTDAMLWTAGYLRLGTRAVRADLADRLLRELIEARRASETAAFAVPAKLAAGIGCPGPAFEGVLRALGLKPAQRDSASGAATLWRFPARPRPVETAVETMEASGPFAALAALAAPALPAAGVRRRRSRRKSGA